jgi:hypothetical protein
LPALNWEALDSRVASESFAAVRPLGAKDLETLSLLTEILEDKELEQEATIRKFRIVRREGTRVEKG